MDVATCAIAAIDGILGPMIQTRKTGPLPASAFDRTVRPYRSPRPDRRASADLSSRFSADVAAYIGPTYRPGLDRHAISIPAAKGVDKTGAPFCRKNIDVDTRKETALHTAASGRRPIWARPPPMDLLGPLAAEEETHRRRRLRQIRCTLTAMDRRFASAISFAGP